MTRYSPIHTLSSDITQNHGTVNIIYHDPGPRRGTLHCVHPPNHISAQSPGVRLSSDKTSPNTEVDALCACKRKSGVNACAADSLSKDTSVFDSIYDRELAENDDDPFRYSLGRLPATNAKRYLSNLDGVPYDITSPWPVAPVASNNPFGQYKMRPEHDAKDDITPDRDKDDRPNAHRLELAEVYRTIKGMQLVAGLDWT